MKIVRFLLEHDADVTAQKTDKETPLHLALQRGQLEVAGMLIERGFDSPEQGREDSITFGVARWTN